VSSIQRHVLGVALVLAGVAAPARADDTDSAAQEAADANLEPPTDRSEIIPSFGFGGGFTVGFGVKDSVGTGGAAVLRLAHVASRRALVHMELVGAALFSSIEVEGGMRFNYRTDSTEVLAGGQYYVAPALWLRMAAGTGSFHSAGYSDGTRTVGERRIYGLAGSVGAGVDALAVRHIHAGLELMSTSLLTRDGVVTASALLVSLSLQ
jgi:hypothetical protein